MLNLRGISNRFHCVSKKGYECLPSLKFIHFWCHDYTKVMRLENYRWVHTS